MNPLLNRSGSRSKSARRPDYTVTTSPVCKRSKLSILNYIHTELFREGSGSDIKISALNRDWNLHKNILSQSPYFKSMFSGSWSEKRRRKIYLSIEDINITTEAMNTIFESLYTDEIHIELTDVVPILAGARFLLLDDLINHCAEVMKSCINMDTVIRIFEVSDFYDVTEVKNLSIDFLCRTVWDMLQRNPKTLTVISEDLLKELLPSPNLCLPEEKDVFSLLISWVFLKENSFNFDFDSLSELYNSSIIYFEGNVSGKPFLETDSGIPYQPLFRAIRLQNIFLKVHYGVIEQLNIYPAEWIVPVFRTHWYTTLRILQGLDDGPQSVSEEVFDRECIRISGSVSNGDSWSYSYFDFGFGLVFIYEHNHFRIKRYLKAANSTRSVKRYLMYRVSLFGGNIDGGVSSIAETGIKTIKIAPNKMINVMVFPFHRFPVRYKINFLLTTP